MEASRPEATWVGSPHFTPGRRGYLPVAIVYHIMDGTLAGTDAWFRNPRSRVSSHYGIGKDGTIHQYVREEDAAWANGVVNRPSWPLLDRFPGVNPNLYTLSIEHEGRPGEPFPEPMYRATLALTRWLVSRWRIPVDRDHLVGHYRLDSVNRADCPGPAFPWERLFADLAQPGPFPDVPPDDPDAAAIAWARERGLMVGFADGLFRPDDRVTRRQLAVVLQRLARYLGKE